MEQYMEFIKSIVNGYGFLEIDHIDFSEIFATAKIVTLEKHQIWLHEGEMVKDFSLVLDGLMRLFYVNESGKEFTKNFAIAGDGCGVLSAILQKKPARMNIEALAETKLLVFDFNLVMQLAERDFVWSKIFNGILIHSYLEKEDRESELLYHDALTRYEGFVQKFPMWDQLIPRKYIASYLGMSAETLSRIISKAD